MTNCYAELHTHNWTSNDAKLKFSIFRLQLTTYIFYKATYLGETFITNTIFIQIEARAFISYKRFLTRRLYKPFCILHRCLFTLEH